MGITLQIQQENVSLKADSSLRLMHDMWYIQFKLSFFFSLAKEESSTSGSSNEEIKSEEITEALLKVSRGEKDKT